MALQLLLGCSSGEHRKGCKTCDFQGLWQYDSARCMLTFTVSGYTEGCILQPIEDSNLSVVISGPGSIGPVVEYPGFGFKRWTKFKPASGSTYTATVTLTCEDSSTVTRTYTYTAPSPANTNCTCCSERTIDYMTVSGFSGVGASVNGTHVPVDIGLGPPFFSCLPLFGENKGGPCSRYALNNHPGEVPATGKCNPSAPGLLTVVYLANSERYVYAGGAVINVMIPSVNNALLPPSSPYKEWIMIYIAYGYQVFELRYSDSTCRWRGSLYYEEWGFRVRCDGGAATLYCYEDQASSILGSIGTPSVNVFFAP